MTIARHRLPFPAERAAQMAFVFDPGSGRLIAPWPPHRLDEERLAAVLARIARLRVDRVVWVWPDEREPVAVESRDVMEWLRHWARDRASYVALVAFARRRRDGQAMKLRPRG